MQEGIPLPASFPCLCTLLRGEGSPGQCVGADHWCSERAQFCTWSQFFVVPFEEGAEMPLFVLIAVNGAS